MASPIITLIKNEFETILTAIELIAEVEKEPAIIEDIDIKQRPYTIFYDETIDYQENNQREINSIQIIIVTYVYNDESKSALGDEMDLLEATIHDSIMANRGNVNGLKKYIQFLNKLPQIKHFENMNNGLLIQRYNIKYNQNLGNSFLD